MLSNEISSASAQTEQVRQSLEDQLIAFAGHMNAAEFRLICLLDEFDQAKGWQSDGILSFSHWLNWKLGMGAVIAREKVRVARALRDLPLTTEAFRLGEISYTKVRAITRAGTAENEDFLLMIARHGTASHLENLVRKFKRAEVCIVDYEQEPNWKPDASFSYYFDDDGFLVFRGRLPPDEGELLVQAIEAMQSQMLEENQHDVSAETSEEDEKEVGKENDNDDADVSAETFTRVTEFDEEEPFKRSQADALSRIAEHFLASSPAEATPGDTSTRNQVFLHINTALDTNYLDSGHYVPNRVVEQFTCDCSVTPVWEDAKGNVISIGRKSRVVPPKMRFAIDQRDRGCCRFPGCRQRRWADKHHIKHWSDGGETSMDNLVTLCRKHHRLVHKGEYTIRSEPDRIVFVDRRKHEIPVAFSPEPGQPLELLNQLEGLDIDHQTAASRWRGEQMDYDYSVASMFTLGEY
jgi:hypothetical protein